MFCWEERKTVCPRMDRIADSGRDQRIAGE